MVGPESRRSVCCPMRGGVRARGSFPCSTPGWSGPNDFLEGEKKGPVFRCEGRTVCQYKGILASRCTVFATRSEKVARRSARASNTQWFTHAGLATCSLLNRLHQQPLEIAPSVMAAWSWRFVVTISWLTESRATSKPGAARGSERLRGIISSLAPIQPSISSRQYPQPNCYRVELEFPVTYRKHKVGIASNRYTFDDPRSVVIPSDPRWRGAEGSLFDLPFSNFRFPISNDVTGGLR